METVRSLPTLPAHSPVSSNSRLGNMPATYNQAPQTPSRPPSQQSGGPPSHHSSRSGHQMVDSSPYKMRTGPVGQGGLHISGMLGHAGHEPVTPPPPPSHSTHSNLSQLARTHPYANAISTTVTGVTVGGRYGVPSSGLYSNAYSRMDPRDAPTSFPLRSPPDRPGEFRRNRLTLLPHGAPAEYGSIMHNLSGPGPGGGGRPHPYTLPPLPYSASQNDSYREPVYLSVSSATSEPLHKKLRVTDNGSDGHQPKAELGQPLRIDTRPPPQSRNEQQAYIPQVEAISPTLPGEGDDSKRDDSPPRSTKEDLLQQINKVDREIMKAESNILKLKKKLQDLEEAAKKPPEAAEITAQIRPKNQSVAQQIYADNRKKAQAAHQTLSPLGPPVDLPLYHQPSDTAVYHKNRTQYAAFRPRLLKFLQRRHKGKELRDRHLTVTYNKLLSGWIRRVSDMEKAAASSAAAAAGVVATSSSSSANAPAAAGQAASVPLNPALTKKKEREFYEKVFPELRKQREDKERFNRVGSRIKSDADLEEIMDGLQEQENEDKKMRSLAVVPPILLDARERRYRFDNRNGLVEDPMAEHRERQLLNVWTEQEREIFKEKYLQHPKNFVTVAAYLERKSVADCVQFYYLSKKTVNYKQLLRKTKMKRNTRSTMQKPGAASAAAASAAAAAAAAQNQAQGVTTRLQREQQSRQETASSTAAMSTTSSVISVTAASSGTPSSSSSTETVTTTSTVTSVISIGMQNLAPSATTAPPQSEDGNSAQAPAAAVATAAAAEQLQKADEKERRRDKWPEKSEAPTVDSSDDEADGSSVAANATGGGPHPCAVCKTVLEHFGQSRRLPKHQASQYGLHENDVNDDTRVCSACRCQVVRRRYFTCTLPTCPTAKRRVKRLRPLPNKWVELPAEIRSILENEFQIGPGVTKCCSTCSNRISRRLSALTGTTSIDATRNSIVEGSRQENDGSAGGIPTLSSGEEMSGSSTSSGEDDVQSDVDTMQIVTEAPEVAAVGAKEAPAAVDNSETDSADEVGANAIGHGEIMGPPHPMPEKVSAAPVPIHAPSAPAAAPPMTSAPQETLTVKDIMLGMIERSLSRDNSHASPSPAMGVGFSASSQLPGPSESPTITSILKESRNYVVGGKPGGGSPIVAVSLASSTPPMVLPPQVQVQISSRPQLHHPEVKQQVPEHSSLVSQNRRSSPYPVGMFPPPPHMLPPGSYVPHEADPNLPREGLAAVLHGQQAARDYERDRARMREPPPTSSECQTLDLSMPKKRDNAKDESSSSGPSVSLPPASAYSAYPPPAHSKLPPPSVTIEQYRGPPSVMDPVAMYQHQQGMRPSTPHQKLAPPSVQSSRPSGSITQGTPVGQSHHHPISFQPPPRTDGLLRTVPPPPRDTPGSITQGTPILHVKDQQPSHHYERASPLNYYKSSASPASTPGVPRGPYPQDPQQSSRQIIINDYLTSQQMVGGSGGRREREHPTSHPQSLTIERASEARGAYAYRYPAPVYLPRGTTYVDQHPGHQQPQQQPPPPPQQHQQQPPPQQHQQQQRQGVIQRTSSVPQPRPSDSRPVNSHPAPQPPLHHAPHGRTASPGMVHISAAGHYQPGRPQILAHRDPRDYAEDPFNALVNAAVAQPSLPVPGNTRDRDRQPIPGPPPRLVPDRKDEGSDRVMAFQRESPKVGAPPPGPAPGDTLTAASLIDAIITHQINQTAANQGDSGGKSSIDSLFSRYRRNASPTDARPATSKEREEPPSQPQPPKAVLTLGEHVESIIVKDFHQGGGPQPNEQSWERERERNWQRQHNEYMKSRIAEGFAHGRDNPGLDYGKARESRSPASAPSAVDLVKGRGGGHPEVRVVEQDNRAPISPLDYVKNRIKEVMRTSDNCQTESGRDMRPPSSPSAGGRRGVSPAPSPNKRPRMTPEADDAYPPPPHPPGQAHQPHYIPGPYPGMAYTYMPLSMGMSNSAPPSSSSQPTVVLSSQYETLSDED